MTVKTSVYAFVDGRNDENWREVEKKIERHAEVNMLQLACLQFSAQIAIICTDF